MSSFLPSEPIDCTIDRWVNGRVVLKLIDGQELTVARRHLPKELVEGDTLQLHIFTESASLLRRDELAQAILKEILQG